MGSLLLTPIPYSLVPIPIQGIPAWGAWAPEPVFTIEESARILGVSKRAVEQVRHRHPEAKLEPSEYRNRSYGPGPVPSEYGEVTLPIYVGERSQDHVCLTHRGLFLHALYIRTPQARSFCRAYPELIRRIAVGEVKPLTDLPESYRRILEAPHGQKGTIINELARNLGKSERTLQRHCKWIRDGKVGGNGLPLLRKPGPPKGFIPANRRPKPMPGRPLSTEDQGPVEKSGSPQPPSSSSTP